MAYEVRFGSRRIVRELARLLEGDPALRELLPQVLDRLARNPHPDGRHIKKLQGHPEYAIRLTRRYRIVFRIDGETVVITAVGHRRDVYRHRG